MNKTILKLWVASLALGSIAAEAQRSQLPPQVQMDKEMMRRYGLVPSPNAVQPSDPTIGQPLRPNVELPGARFDLDFLGGNARDLVAEIEAAMEREINVIVPTELESVPIPAFRVSKVTLSQVFKALEGASGLVPDPNSRQSNFQNRIVDSRVPRLGFRSTDEVPAEDSIYYFYYNGEPLIEQGQESVECRFYSLGEFLDPLTVEDITTAIQTGWEMLGVAKSPKVSFHAETQLLIAVGHSDHLMLIDQVLQKLANGNHGAPANSVDARTRLRNYLPPQPPVRK